MAMDFPDDPAPGDIYGPYTWDGEKWITTGSSGGGEGGGGIDQATADLRYVNVAGDVMTGELTLPWLNATGGIGGGPDGNALLSVDQDETVSLWSPWSPTASIHIGPSGEMHSTYNGKSHKFGNEVGFQYATLDEDGLLLPLDPTLALHAATKQYVDAVAGGGGGGDYLPLSGGTLTGFLTLHMNPTSSRHAATKEYVDSAVGAQFDNRFVNTTGDTMTGMLQLKADPSTPLHAATKQYVDSIAMAGGSFIDAPSDGQQYARQDANWAVVAGGSTSGDYLPLSGGTLTGFLSLHSDPVRAMEAATKGYVDAMVAAGGGGGGGDYLPLTGGTVSGDIIMTEWGTQLQLMSDGNQLNTTLHFGTPGTGIYGDVNAVRIAAGEMHVANFLKDSVSFFFPVSLPTTDPTAVNHATTKAYVDAAIAAIGGGGGSGGDFLPLAGGTLTGALQLPNGTNAAPALAFATAGNGFSADATSIKATLAGQPVLTLGGYILTSLAIRGADGWSGSPAYSFGSEFNSGLFKKASGSISISVSTKEVINWKGVDKSTTVYGPLILNADPVVALEAASKQYVDAAVAGAGGGAEPPIAISFPFSGKPAVNAVVNIPVVFPIRLGQWLGGSISFAGVAATTSAYFRLFKVVAGVETEIGQIYFDNSAAVHGSWSGTSGSLAVGDVLRMKAPDVQDATLADVGLTVWAERV